MEVTDFSCVLKGDGEQVLFVSVEVNQDMAFDHLERRTYGLGEVSWEQPLDHLLSPKGRNSRCENITFIDDTGMDFSADDLGDVVDTLSSMVVMVPEPIIDFHWLVEIFFRWREQRKGSTVNGFKEHFNRRGCSINFGVVIVFN